MTSARQTRRSAFARRGPAWRGSAVAVSAVAAALTAGAAGPAPVPPRAGIIRTIAGGVGGPAAGTLVAMASPCGVAADGGGVVVTESNGNMLRRLSLSGRLTALAGVALPGLTSDSQPRPGSALNGPCGVALGPGGDVAVADAGSGRMLVLASTSGTLFGRRMRHGQISTVGKNLGGEAVAFDHHGNLVIATPTTFQPGGGEPGPGSAEVQVIAAKNGEFYGRAMTAGNIYTIAGNACATAGSNGCPPGFAGDGGPALAAVFSDRIQAIAVDAAGNIVLTDTGNDRVRVIVPAAGDFYGQHLAAGTISTIAGDGTAAFSGDGGPALAAGMTGPAGVAVASNGDVVISDSGDQRVRVVAEARGAIAGQPLTPGNIYALAGDGQKGFAGDGGAARAAALRDPAGVAVAAGGDVVIADAGNNRVRVVALGSGTRFGRRMRAGHIYTVAGDGRTSFSGDGGLATRAQFAPFAPVVSNGSGGDLRDPGSLAVSPAGDLVVSDGANDRIRVVATRAGTRYGLRIRAGHTYTIAGTGAGGFSGDDGLATRARLRNPQGVATDAAGDVVIADAGNERVRVVAARHTRLFGRAMRAGEIATIAGGGASQADGVPATQAMINPLGLAVDGAGNVVIANFLNVRVVAARSGTFYGVRMRAGHIYSVGQGWGVPLAVAIDHHGSLVVADDDPGNIRVLAARAGTFYGIRMRAGHTYVVAGSTRAGLSGDGGPARSARLDDPGAVTVDAAGDLLIADSINNRVRVVAARSGGFYGVRMRRGDIYTVAGGGTFFGVGAAGFSGDGGPGTKARLSDPCGVAALGKRIVVLDSQNHRVREITG